jgi:hypothetical protein
MPTDIYRPATPVSRNSVWQRKEFNSAAIASSDHPPGDLPTPSRCEV